jgi:hypothetical protein
MSHHSFAPIISAELAASATTETQQPYYPPAVIYEASLEVRAGTPIDLANPLELP